MGDRGIGTSIVVVTLAVVVLLSVEVKAKCTKQGDGFECVAGYQDRSETYKTTLTNIYTENVKAEIIKSTGSCSSSSSNSNSNSRGGGGGSGSSSSGGRDRAGSSSSSNNYDSGSRGSSSNSRGSTSSRDSSSSSSSNGGSTGGRGGSGSSRQKRQEERDDADVVETFMTLAQMKSNSQEMTIPKKGELVIDMDRVKSRDSCSRIQIKNCKTVGGSRLDCSRAIIVR